MMRKSQPFKQLEKEHSRKRDNRCIDSRAGRSVECLWKRMYIRADETCFLSGRVLVVCKANSYRVS